MNVEFYLLTGFGLICGLYFLIRNLKLYFNDNALRVYLSTSLKGKAYVAKHGMEDAMQHTKKYFLPIGLIIALCLLYLGIRNVIIIIQLS